MAEPLFLEGQPPDFSLLQRLLCLEPELGPPLLPPPSPGSPGDTGNPGDTGTGDTGRTGLPAPPPSPPGAGLTFLQETVQLLAPPPPPPAPPAAPPERAGAPPRPPGGPDALSIISTQCRHLAGETGNGCGTGDGNGSGNGDGNGSGNGSGTGDGNGSGNGSGTSDGNGCGNGSGSGSGSGRRRKQAAPQRGADPRDPFFRGVTVRMRLSPPSGSTGGFSLRITARRAPGRIWGCRPPAPPGVGSSSEDDAALNQGRRRCASCRTRRTPLWRVAENGTPLCNACGIRYRKYRVRCWRCWNVPGKSGTPRCPRCWHRWRPQGGGGGGRWRLWGGGALGSN